MSGEERLKIVIDAENQGSDELKGAATDTKQIEQSAVEASRAQARLAAAMFDVEDAALKLSKAELALSQNTNPEKQHALANAVADARVELIGAEEKAEKFSGKLEDVAQSGDKVSQSGGGMVTSLADVKAGFDMASQVIDKVGQALDATVGKAARWGDDMGDLAQLTGQSVEETSLMAATFELVGIKGETLTKVLKTLSQDGINLNMRELGSLAEKYQALQDPVEKNRFLFEHFGRSAADMAEIMGRSKEELDKLTAAAKSSGKVIGEEAAEAAEKLNIQWAILQQRGEGLAITVGNVAIPAINGFVDSVVDANKHTAQSTINLLENTGAISANEAALRREAVASGDVFAALVNQTTTTSDLVHDTDRLTTSTDTAGLAINSYSIEVVAAAQHNNDGAAAIYAKNLALEAEARATAALKIGMGELTTQTIFQAASEGLSSEAKLQLAASMGLVDQKAVEVAGKIEDLKKKYDTNRDGIIDLKEATSGYLGDLQAIKDKADSIPDHQVKIIEIVTQGGDVKGGDFGQLLTSDVNGNRQVRRAWGGPYSVGSSVIFNEDPGTRPEVVVADQRGGGYVLTKQDAQAALGGGGQNNITINVSGAGDPQAVAREVSRILAAQVRGLSSAGASVLGR